MRAFQHFDKDNSGTINRDELKEALKVRVWGEGAFVVEQAGGTGFHLLAGLEHQSSCTVRVCCSAGAHARAALPHAAPGVRVCGHHGGRGD